MALPAISGRVGRWHASFEVDPGEPSRSEIEVVVDAGSLETGAIERDNHTRSPQFLDIGSFPEIRFRSKDVRGGDGEGRFVIAGDLTVRDVTREVTVFAELQHGARWPHEGTKLVFAAHATVNRQDFGLRWNQLDRQGAVAGDRIDLRIRVEARRAASRPCGERARPGRS